MSPEGPNFLLLGLTVGSVGRSGLDNFWPRHPYKESIVVISPPGAKWRQFRSKLGCMMSLWCRKRWGSGVPRVKNIFICGLRNLISTVSGPTINNLMMPNLMVRGFIISLGCRSVVTFVWLTRGEQPGDPAMFLRRFMYDFLRGGGAGSCPYPKPIRIIY